MSVVRYGKEGIVNYNRPSGQTASELFTTIPLRNVCIRVDSTTADTASIYLGSEIRDIVAVTLKRITTPTARTVALQFERMGGELLFPFTSVATDGGYKTVPAVLPTNVELSYELARFRDANGVLPQMFKIVQRDWPSGGVPADTSAVFWLELQLASYQ